MTATERATAPKAAEPAVFIDTACEAFERAAANAGGVREHTVELAGNRILLRFAGERLVPLFLRALAHREVRDAGPCALTVCFFDSESTGVAMPHPPWSADQYTNLGEIDGYNDDRIRVVYQPGVDILQCFDGARNLGVYWAPTWRLIPWWEQSFPLRAMLNWWMKDRPLQPVHAAAVGRRSGGFLITGPSGAGKSTTALACLGSELRYAGDDYVVVGTDAPARAFSLYNTAKMEAGDVWRLPHLRPAISNADRLDREKALIFLQECDASQLIAEFPIQAIVVPRITGLADTTVERTTAMTALTALAPTTTKHLRGTKRETLEKLLRLTRAAPAYQLNAGTDLKQIPDVLLRLSDSLNGRR
jgi:hypothetical protein